MDGPGISHLVRFFPQRSGTMRSGVQVRDESQLWASNHVRFIWESIIPVSSTNIYVFRSVNHINIRNQKKHPLKKTRSEKRRLWLTNTLSMYKRPWNIKNKSDNKRIIRRLKHEAMTPQDVFHAADQKNTLRKFQVHIG